jgi:hypothetical protein
MSKPTIPPDQIIANLIDRWHWTFEGLKNGAYDSYMALSRVNLGGRQIESVDELITELYRRKKLPPGPDDEAVVERMFDDRSCMGLYHRPTIGYLVVQEEEEAENNTR